MYDSDFSLFFGKCSQQNDAGRGKSRLNLINNSFFGPYIDLLSKQQPPER